MIYDNRIEGKGGVQVCWCLATRWQPGTSMLLSCHQTAGQRFMKNVDVASFRIVGVIKCTKIAFFKKLKKHVDLRMLLTVYSHYLISSHLLSEEYGD